MGLAFFFLFFFMESVAAHVDPSVTAHGETHDPMPTHFSLTQSWHVAYT